MSITFSPRYEDQVTDLTKLEIYGATLAEAPRLAPLSAWTLHQEAIGPARRLGEYGVAFAACQASLAIAERLGRDELLALSMLSEASIHLSMQCFDAAERIFEGVVRECNAYALWAPNYRLELVRKFMQQRNGEAALAAADLMVAASSGPGFGRGTRAVAQSLRAEALYFLGAYDLAYEQLIESMAALAACGHFAGLLRFSDESVTFVTETYAEEPVCALKQNLNALRAQGSGRGIVSVGYFSGLYKSCRRTLAWYRGTVAGVKARYRTDS